MLGETEAWMQPSWFRRGTIWALDCLNLPCYLWHNKSNVFLWGRHKVSKSSGSWSMWFSNDVTIIHILELKCIFSYMKFFCLIWWCRDICFRSSSEPNAPKITDWTKADLDNIFTTNGTKPGWCNVDPAEAYASKVKFKEECDCKYDGLLGRFCEIPVSCICINQCSGHGHCMGGFCQVISHVLFSSFLHV